jgi:hypothetical protein
MHPDPRTGSAAGAARLLERDEEFLAIDDAIHAALAGDGTAVVLEGPAGIGKTSLLDAARRRAVEAGMTAIASHGAFLESDFAFGVVRQLFTPVIASASASERQHLLEGGGSPGETCRSARGSWARRATQPTNRRGSRPLLADREPRRE